MDILELLSVDEISGSNLVKVVEKGLKIAENISEGWALSEFDDKRELQNLIFPEGILYNKQKDRVRTPRMNSIFALIPAISRSSKTNKKGHLVKNDLKSHWVELAGIEPHS